MPGSVSPASSCNRRDAKPHGDLRMRSASHFRIQPAAARDSMAQRRILLLVLSALAVISSIRSASGTTVLALPMLGGNSPSLDVMSVAGELQLRGYNLLTAVADVDIEFMQKAIARHRKEQAPAGSTPGYSKFISFTAPEGAFKTVMQNALSSSNNTGVKLHKIMPKLLKAIAAPCQQLLNNETAMKAIRAAQPDVVLSFDIPFGADSCACIMSHALGVPFVTADGNPMLRGPLTMPQFGSGLTPADLKQPFGMLKNIFAFIRNQGLMTLLPMFTSAWPAVRKATGMAPAHQFGGCHPATQLKLNSFLLEWPRPVTPGLLMLGPGSPRLPRSPEQQQKSQPATWEFLQSADPNAGVVLVGFGSTGIFGLSMVAEDYINLAAAFTDLAPTRVVWALLPSNLPVGVQLEDLHLGSNVLVVPWVDYNDVLGHPNTKLFISHCGIHSMYEAAFHGVPVIGVPFQNEQRDNARRLAAHGLGELCQEAVAFRSASRRLVYQRESMRGLARKILTTPSYYAAAGDISAKLQAHAAFRSPVERAADELEVLLANGNRRLHNQGVTRKPVTAVPHGSDTQQLASDTASVGDDAPGFIAEEL